MHKFKLAPLFLSAAALLCGVSAKADIIAELDSIPAQIQNEYQSAVKEKSMPAFDPSLSKTELRNLLEKHLGYPYATSVEIATALDYMSDCAGPAPKEVFDIYYQLDPNFVITGISTELEQKGFFTLYKVKFLFSFKRKEDNMTFKKLLEMPQTAQERQEAFGYPYAANGEVAAMLNWHKENGLENTVAEFDALYAQNETLFITHIVKEGASIRFVYNLDGKTKHTTYRSKPDYFD